MLNITKNCNDRLALFPLVCHARSKLCMSSCCYSRRSLLETHQPFRRHVLQVVDTDSKFASPPFKACSTSPSKGCKKNY